MQASELMSKDLFTVRENQDFNYVEVFAENKHVRHVPVVNDKEELVGMVSVRNLLEHLSKASSSHFIPIKNIMCTNLITAQTDTPVTQIALMMQDNNVSAIPILNKKQLVGIISERDFLNAYLETNKN